MSTAPLAGLRVVDLTRYIPGPYATLMLADLGAEVVRVEPPEGDPIRVFPPHVGGASGGESAAHAALNRGKRSVVVDLRKEGGAAVVRRLAERADVLVEGFRPGVLARHGLGAAALLEACPRLVYCSLTGYGQEGPHAARAGHDLGYAALGGFLGAHAEDGRPVVPGTPVIDMTAGLLAAVGILAALQARDRTGRGQHVDVSLLRAALSLMSLPLARVLAGGSWEAADELTGVYPCYAVYRCRDGRSLAVAALEPKFWQGLCAAIGRPELAEDQWARGERRERVRAELAAVFASRDRDEWVRALAGHDVCVEPVLAIDEVARHPATAPELWDQPVGTGTLRAVAPAVRLGAGRRPAPTSAPARGADTGAVLAEAGYSGADLDAMRAAGVLG